MTGLQWAFLLTSRVCNILWNSCWVTSRITSLHCVLTQCQHLSISHVTCSLFSLNLILLIYETYSFIIGPSWLLASEAFLVFDSVILWFRIWNDNCGDLSELLACKDGVVVSSVVNFCLFIYFWVPESFQKSLFWVYRGKWSPSPSESAFTGDL